MELTSYDGKKVEFTTELSQNQMFPQSSYRAYIKPQYFLLSWSLTDINLFLGNIVKIIYNETSLWDRKQHHAGSCNYNTKGISLDVLWTHHPTWLANK